MKRCIVDVRVLQRYKAALDEINQLDLDSIVWVKDGVKVQLSAEEISEWKFTGLSNVCFMEINEKLA